MKTLVLGIGNLLLCDEGVGVHVVRELLKADLPSGTEVMEVGTAILDALPAIESAERIIVVDAVQADGTPGTIYRMPFDAFAPSRVIASMHGFDLSRVLALAGRTDQPRITVIGIEPAVVDWSMDLSPSVANVLPLAAEAVLDEILAGATGASGQGASTG
ncbi:MAG: hydrogenase maturation protease [Syntrophobacteraceae bacterium]|jgi:hydrogenase maturation protease|nr:hydrogenase maturation protease [Syntrophobacteraceae bacterium]